MDKNEVKRSGNGRDLYHPGQGMRGVLRGYARQTISRIRRRLGRLLRRGTVAGGADMGEFDPLYYLRHNPDVAASGMDPYQHYMMHGKAEGRIAAPLRLAASMAFQRLRPERESVLVVSHEASLTGAPVLSWNLVAELAPRYNVVVLLLGGGPLTDDFARLGAAVVGPFRNIIRAPQIVDSILDEILEQVPLRFAITNSVVSTAVCAALAARYIPNVPLIHEFAAYTRPRGLFESAALWSGQLVFSTRLTLQNAMEDEPAVTKCRRQIIPQGLCRLPPREDAEPPQTARGDTLKQDILGRSPRGDEFVVLGLGTVQLRKGVELFIAAAHRIVALDAATNYRFVWIGPNFRPEDDFEYSAYLADQIKRSGLKERLTILPETPDIEVAYDLADMLLLSSRLDPLPNVALDVMSRGIPLVCFDQTTGLADVLAEEGLRDRCVAAYLDVHDMADKAIAFARDAEYRAAAGAALKAISQRRFDMRRYVAQLEELAAIRHSEIDVERDQAQRIAKAGLLDPAFALPPTVMYLSQEQAANFHIRCWTSGISCRKPFPGFHPGVYREVGMPAGDTQDPLLHYIEAGRPDGPWSTEVITEHAPLVEAPAKTRIALHLHVYYADMLPAILHALEGNRTLPDLLVSVPSDPVRREVDSALQAYRGKVARVAVVPNRGRDIGPMLTEFGPLIRDSYDIFGHVHTKKTVDIADVTVSEKWTDFLFENVLGGARRIADRIVARLATDPGLGMIFPDNPGCIGWDKNRRHAEPLAERLGITRLPTEFNFPVGTMFWARTDALRALLDLRLAWDDYPAEPLGYDGSMLHALERLLPLVVKNAGMGIAVTRCGQSNR
jgi:glycosyltransferase involved in cell wall biosynthesis